MSNNNQPWERASSGLLAPRRRRPPGLVVIPVTDYLRHPEFFSAFTQLRVPAGSMTGVARGFSVVTNLNMSIEQLRDHHEWVFIMGDDHVFPATLLEQLLDLNVDVAVPLCVKRAPPFELVIFRERSEDIDGYPAYVPFMPGQVPDHPFPVVAAGSAGMLVRRRVIEAIPHPWFENTDGAGANEDLVFCAKIRQAGFEIICDPHAFLGHIGSYHVWPVWHDGRVAIKVDCGGPPGLNEVLIEDDPALYETDPHTGV